MALEKTLAVVIRSSDFSEASSVVTLFTRDFGKITALAKGCKRPKSAFESALDLLTLSRIVFLHKKGEGLDLLTEAKVDTRFRAGERNIESLYAGYYMAELLAALTDRSDPHPELFDEVVAILHDLNHKKPMEPLVLRFEMMLLRYIGQLPELEQCVETGEPLPKQGRTPFGLAAGGIISRRARAGHRQVIDVSVKTPRLMARFARPGDAWKDSEIPPQIRMELRALVNRYLADILGRYPKMREFLRILAI